MEVLNVKGVANHNGPESCAVAGNRDREALTGESTGWVMSREIRTPLRKQWALRGADAVERSGRQHSTHRYREMRRDPARSKTPCTYRNTACGNREIPRLSVPEGVTDRIGKSKDNRR